ncbi:hypothetical protein KP509_16G034700 [Ceratopteris richardii]|nr:hypothetical protein KP509_16G034700 [Ceratopteris richardii]
MGMTLSATNFLFQLVVRISESLHNASSILVNTVEELELEAIAALRAHTPIYPVGPLLLLPGQASRLPINYWPEDDQCLPWLDAQAPRTVLFVSFGSVASVSLSQFQDLALGLEASGQPFLWVVRPDSINAPLQEALPDGFLDRTKNKGLIISWGPQLLILSHPSIGGFMTHGGWNSLTENIATGSVPMICWPHVAEQRVNRFLVTSVWKIGLRLHHNEDGSVSKGEIARAVRELFNGQQSTDLRNKSEEVSDIAKKAIAEGGSSHTNFEKLCNLLCA